MRNGRFCKKKKQRHLSHKMHNANNQFVIFVCISLVKYLSLSLRFSFTLWTKCAVGNHFFFLLSVPYMLSILHTESAKWRREKSKKKKSQQELQTNQKSSMFRKNIFLILIIKHESFYSRYAKNMALLSLYLLSNSIFCCCFSSLLLALEPQWPCEEVNLLLLFCARTQFIIVEFFQRPSNASQHWKNNNNNNKKKPSHLFRGPQRWQCMHSCSIFSTGNKLKCDANLSNSFQHLRNDVMLVILPFYQFNYRCCCCCLFHFLILYLCSFPFLFFFSAVCILLF